MEIVKTEIASFKRNSDFYGRIDIAFTIKSFELDVIRKRYLKSQKENKTKTGSVERRENATGGIAVAYLEKGCLGDYSVLAKMPEPRAIDVKDNIVSFSSEKNVYLLIKDKLETIGNEWFSYIHTVDIQNDKILISSSGFDAIFEYDIIRGKKISEWFAWENGFNIGHDPKTGEDFFLTRDNEEAQKLKMQGKNFLLINNPLEQTLPTARRAAFINSVVYDDSDTSRIISTFFHEGAVYSINLKNGHTSKVLEGLKNPHGGMKVGEFFAATSTGTGEFAIGNLDKVHRYSFKELPGKPVELSKFEWIQNTKNHNGNYIAIDSNRNCFIVFNIDRKVYDMVGFDSSLAIQDLAVATLDDNQKSEISRLSK